MLLLQIAIRAKYEIRFRQRITSKITGINEINDWDTVERKGNA